MSVNLDKKIHWGDVYANTSATEVSWFQEKSTLSLQLIESTGTGASSSVIDVGGGASPLVDDLLEKGFQEITVLDISGAALAVARKRIGSRASQVNWLEADIIAANLPPYRYDVWHDRAVFHFLISEEDRRKYIEQVRRSVKPGGHVVISTFALDGPDRCSGLDIVRYNSDTLTEQFGGGFVLQRSERESHSTPFGTQQIFQYCLFAKL